MEMTRDATASEEKSSRSYWGFVLWPVVVVVLYVLSEGPYMAAARNGLISWNLQLVYYPLDELIDKVGLERPYGRYLHLWCPEMYNKDGSDNRGDAVVGVP